MYQFFIAAVLLAAAYAVEEPTYITEKGPRTAGRASPPPPGRPRQRGVITLDYDRQIARRLQQSRVWLAALLIGTAGAIAVAGVSSEVVLRWGQAAPLLAPIAIGPDAIPWHVPPGPLFVGYQLYLLATLSAAAGVLAWLWRLHPRGTPLHARFGGLLLSSVLFLLGGAYLALASAILGACTPGGRHTTRGSADYCSR